MMLDYYDKLYDIWARESECLARVDVDCRYLRGFGRFIASGSEKPNEVRNTSDQRGPTADASANAELVLRAAERL